MPRNGVICLAVITTPLEPNPDRLAALSCEARPEKPLGCALECDVVARPQDVARPRSGAWRCSARRRRSTQSLTPCTPQTQAWTVCIKRTDAAEYVPMFDVDPELALGRLKASWLSAEGLQAVASFVSLRLVRIEPGPPDPAEEDAARRNEAALLRDPTASLRAAGLGPQCWLLAEIPSSLAASAGACAARRGGARTPVRLPAPDHTAAPCQAQHQASCTTRLVRLRARRASHCEPPPAR
jgi:hypothetical protein